jgi:predicted RNA binding protein YcfA (HicA-like mRNA interferase family)
LRLPRDLSGTQLATSLGRFGYETTRQTGSHLRLTSTVRGHPHHITIPRHGALRVGTLAAILGDVATYLERDRREIADELFRG